jgi:anthranilate synthase/aminodeoxychorismate synthase-like glutamine amidotransferase
MILLFDNYDSFTYNLKDYIEQCGEEVLVVQNDSHSVEELLSLKFDAVVLSPGPGRPENSGILMEFIEQIYRTVPILGICLGHQALAMHFGAELIRAPYPMHGKVSVVETAAHQIFTGLPKRFEVCRYHSLVVNKKPNEHLRVIAYSEDGCIMAFEHQTLPIVGIQYHPEAILTKHGLEVIDNWLKLLICKT